MATGRYAGYLELRKVVMKGKDGQFQKARDYKAALPINAEIFLDVGKGYALEPIERASTIGGTPGVVPVLGFRIIRK